MSCQTAFRWSTFAPILTREQRRRKILRLQDDEIAVLFVGTGWERKGLRSRDRGRSIVRRESSPFRRRSRP